MPLGDSFCARRVTPPRWGFSLTVDSLLLIVLNRAHYLNRSLMSLLPVQTNFLVFLDNEFIGPTTVERK
jgi:hypothetical protein